jgi:hypothetical protein
MYMVMLVLDVVDRLDALLDAWHAAGIRGATIAETTGFYRRQTRRRHVAAPHAIGDMGPAGEEHDNYTLWTIVPDEETMRRCLVEAEKVVGDLDSPDTGVLAAWPLALLKGVPSRASASDREEAGWSG